MKNKVVIFGLTDFARVAAVYLDQDSPYEVVAFTANEEFIKEPEMLGKPIVPFEKIEDLYPQSEFAMFVAIGFKRVNKARAEVYELCKQKGYELITYISSEAKTMGEIKVGENCFILENNVIQPFVKIGNNVIVWSGNHIGHDSRIGDHCFIASHAVISGNVSISPYCFIGVNATLRDGISVASECVIGAGALILKNTKEQGVYAAKGTEIFPKLSSQIRSFQ